MPNFKARNGDRHMPLYVQVASALRRQIANGQWQPGQQISTLEELEREYQVARVTVRQAVALLQKEGLLHRQQGRGTFVADKVSNKRWLRLDTTWESLIESIKDNIPKPIPVAAPPQRPTLAEGEGRLAPEYVFLRSVQLKDGEPYAVVNLHLARQIFELDPEAFSKHTALPILASLDAARIKHAHQTIVIGTADRETADLLGIGLSAVTAECRCIVIDRDDVAIYVAEIVYPSDCIKLHIDLLGKSRKRSKSIPAAAAKANVKTPKLSNVKVSKGGKERNQPQVIGRA
jgi:GntR family transcriptional regulator